MTPPNLFSFATSELTQDAFLAYLLAWADPGLKLADGEMHHAGSAFLRLLLELHGEERTAPVSVKVEVQKLNIDVLVYITFHEGKPVLLVIEDKVHAGTYNDLKEYLDNGKSLYPDAEAFGIYLRTGNQANYKVIEDQKFEVVNRRMLLQFLQADDTGNPQDTIFQNYRAYLENYQKQLDAYKTTPLKKWDGNAWVGFFRQQLVADEKLLFNDYGYVANRSGGFQGCWWTTDRRPTFGGYSVYLQIDGSNTENEESWIKVKMETLSTADAKHKGLERINLIRALADRIEAYPEEDRFGLRRPKLRAGQWMTAAIVAPVAQLSPAHPSSHSLQQLYNLQAFIFDVCRSSSDTNA